jgi:flagellar protein FliL
MSATAEAAPKPAGKKKLVIIIAAATVLAVGGGGAGFYFLKPAPAAAKGGDATAAKDAGAAKRDPKAKPTFVPFESFTVNLNDRESERYAQVVFAIETIDAATGDAVKNKMPAVRGRVLMALSSKSATDLMGREGKEQLAKEILVETRKAMDLPEDDKTLIEVHFSQFVMQ